MFTIYLYVRTHAIFQRVLQRCPQNLAQSHFVIVQQVLLTFCAFKMSFNSQMANYNNHDCLIPRHFESFYANLWLQKFR